MNSNFLCKIVIFLKPTSHKMFSNISLAEIPQDSKSCCFFSIFRTSIFVAPSETVSLTQMRQVCSEQGFSADSTNILNVLPFHSHHSYSIAIFVLLRNDD